MIKGAQSTSFDSFKELLDWLLLLMPVAWLASSVTAASEYMSLTESHAGVG